MSQTIPLNVVESGGNVPMTVSSQASELSLDVEHVSVIATIDVTRVAGGVEITVDDYRHEPQTVELYDGDVGPEGQQGPQGDPGVGIATGGAAGQVLAKATADDYDTEWVNLPSTASDVGAIASPASPATGAFLVFDGTDWVAQTLAVWQGGSY